MTLNEIAGPLTRMYPNLTVSTIMDGVNECLLDMRMNLFVTDIETYTVAAAVNYFNIPDGVNAVSRVFKDGEEIPMTLTPDEIEYNAEYSLTGDMRCAIIGKSLYFSRALEVGDEYNLYCTKEVSQVTDPSTTTEIDVLDVYVLAMRHYLEYHYLRTQGVHDKAHTCWRQYIVQRSKVHSMRSPQYLGNLHTNPDR